MKKILALLLCVLLLLSSTACGSPSILNSSDRDNEDSSSILNDAYIDNDGDQDEEEQTNEESTPSNNKTIARGTITGTVYQSDFSGLRFTCPASWVYSTDEEIAAAMNIGAEYLGDKFEEALDNNASVYDMMVVDSATNTNLNISYENLKKSLMTNMTEEQYMEALKSQFDSITTVDITFNNDAQTVRLCGNDYLRATCTTTLNGVTMTQVYYLRNIDGYMNIIVATLVSGYDIADIEAMFD